MASKRFPIICRIAFGFMLLPLQPCLAETTIRFSPTAPKKLLEEIYNNALIGNDRLSDIENYMSWGLKSDYKSALKAVRKGARCDIPRILSNGVFSGKLKGFKVEQDAQKDGKTAFNVMLDVGASDVPPVGSLKQFDPKVFSVVRFTLVRRFINWKIDNIEARKPDLDHIASGVNYIPLDLREILKSCAARPATSAIRQEPSATR